MFEPNPTNWATADLWFAWQTYAQNATVIWQNNIYQAKNAIVGNVNNLNPATDTVNWSLVVPFLTDAVQSGDTFYHQRISVNSNLYAQQNMESRIEYSRQDIVNILSNNVAGYASPLNGLQNRFAAVEVLTNLPYVIMTASFTASARGSYFLDSTGGSIVVTLPANPSINDAKINFTHIDGDVTQATQQITFTAQGKRIMGYTDDLNLDKNYSSFSMVYSDATRGWRTTIL